MSPSVDEGPTPPAGPTPLERAATLLAGQVRRDVPLGPLTTYRVGGPAALFLEAEELDDVLAASVAVGATGVPVLVVGRGSNLLVADAGFPGLAVVLGSGFEWVEIEGARVRAGGATSLPVLARRTARAGLTGLEWAVGVPGSVGGGVRMNAGGHGSDVRATLRRAGIVDLSGGGLRELAADDLALGYRRSAVAAHHVVVWAEFALAPGDRATSEEEIAGIVRWRREHQPGGQNAGSVFANPSGDAAGRLVDAAGLKGFRLGTAQVSEKHANFFQADDGGRADDVKALVDHAREVVARATGVHLDVELRLVGFEPPTAIPFGGSPSSGGRG